MDETVKLYSYITLSTLSGSTIVRIEDFVFGVVTNSSPSIRYTCLQCGKHYRRKIARGHPVWICGTFNTRGKAFCDSSKQIPEDTLMAVTAQVLGLSAFDEHAFSKRVKKIQVGSNFALRYILHDGQVVDTAWTERSRAESWTPEMKAAAKEKALQRRKNT